MHYLKLYIAMSFAMSTSFLADAQIVNLDNNTTPPSFGVGHSYIQDAVETVNPANGSVSLRIKLFTPADRGIELPFSFNYDSSISVQLIPLSYNPDPVSSSGSTPDVVWIPYSNLILGPSAGWNYGLPQVTASSFTANCSANTGYTYQGTGNYFFSDGTGSPHPLNISSSDAGCNTTTPSATVSSGDLHYSATLVGDCYNCYLYDPPLIVSNASGTSYYFSNPAFAAISYIDPNNANDIIGGSFPDYIEDRNGNKVVRDTSNTSVLSFHDTAGRQALSIPISQSYPKSIVVGGLSYGLTWSAANEDYSVNPIQINVPPSPETCSTGVPGVF